MSNDELADVVARGLRRSAMTIAPGLSERIVALSLGLPHYTHLLALHAGLAANQAGRSEINESDLIRAIELAIQEKQQTLGAIHRRAINGSDRDRPYSETLEACAEAPRDEHGTFSRADVRNGVRVKVGRRLSATTVERCLTTLCSPEHGSILAEESMPEEPRYRFSDPLIQPFVLMRTLADERI